MLNKVKSWAKIWLVQLFLLPLQQKYKCYEKVSFIYLCIYIVND